MGKICGVMRVVKRKRTDVYGLQIEANRTVDDHLLGRDFDRSDIDWNLTEQNQHLVFAKNWNREITRQIKEAGIKEVTKGKNQSVVMLDGLYTSSPEWFDCHTQEEALQFFKKCYQFHIEHYCGGDSSRVINAVVHYDEKTPHMQVASIPILDTGEKMKLCAKDIMGNRTDYRHRQDQFYEEVSQHFGMARGEVLEEGEIRLHTTKREWQIATQEERLQEAELKAEKQEKKIRKNEKIIEKQEFEIEKKKKEIESQPHILKKKEMNRLAEEKRPVNKLTGKVTLPQEEYQSLLATKLEAEDLRGAKKEAQTEAIQLKEARKHLEIERADVLEEARREGLLQGGQEQRELVKKGQAFDEMMGLIRDDKELSVSFQKALKPRMKKYPKLAEEASKVFEWVKEQIKRMTQKLRIS